MHVCPNYGIVRGGVERTIDQIASELIRRRHEVILLSGGKEKMSTDSRGVLHISTCPPFSFLGFGVNLRMMNRLLSLEPDIIHVHLNAPVTIELTTITSIFKRIPLVASYNADPVASDILRVRSAARVVESMYSTVMRLECNRFSRIFVLTPIYPRMSKVLRTVPRDKILVAPPGSDHITPFLVPRLNARQALGLTERDKVILFVGRLVKYKGIDVLLKSFATLRRKHPETAFRLLVVGDGRELKPLQELASLLQIEKETRFITGVASDSVASYMCAADVLVLPSISRSEGFGIVLLEALACGVPCVATSMSAGPFLFADGRAGVVVPPLSPNETTEAIDGILSSNIDDWRRDAAEKARTFTWHRTVDIIENAYREAVA